jgi:Type I restriction enzyme R protein N terminus (HSDR_N)
VWLIDFANPDNNEFVVANQFIVIENHQNKRPDLVLFVNGIPLVVIELKNATDENATLKAAYQQFETYKHTKLVAELDAELEQDELTATQQAKAKWTKMEALIGSQPVAAHCR